MSKTILGLVTSLFIIFWGAQFASAQDAASFVKEGAMGDVIYASGGVGFEERQAMDAMAKDFNLKLVFTEGSGAYLSGLTVVIQDEEGNTLIHTASNGPWFFVKLPAGQYNVTVGGEVHQKVQQITVSAGLKTVAFHWSS